MNENLRGQEIYFLKLSMQGKHNFFKKYNLNYNLNQIILKI